jgi:hypothetical protein
MEQPLGALLLCGILNNLICLRKVTHAGLLCNAASRSVWVRVSTAPFATIWDCGARAAKHCAAATDCMGAQIPPVEML